MNQFNSNRTLALLCIVVAGTFCGCSTGRPHASGRELGAGELDVVRLLRAGVSSSEVRRLLGEPKEAFRRGGWYLPEESGGPAAKWGNQHDNLVRTTYQYDHYFFGFNSDDKLILLRHAPAGTVIIAGLSSDSVWK